jgi:hypothetical protein
VDSFGRTNLAWASMGLESHKWMPRAHMPDDLKETPFTLKSTQFVPSILSLLKETPFT